MTFVGPAADETLAVTEVDPPIGADAGVGEPPVQSIVEELVVVVVEKMVSNSANAAYRSEADTRAAAPPLTAAAGTDGAGDEEGLPPARVAVNGVGLAAAPL